MFKCNVLDEEVMLGDIAQPAHSNSHHLLYYPQWQRHFLAEGKTIFARFITLNV